ncbi:hypothetical protein HDU97_005475 [Phlyctochytrium planicorne]|nr:hypothetical protein HDU97_005475 [Phlyctochytrium planicorne]
MNDDTGDDGLHLPDPTAAHLSHHPSSTLASAIASSIRNITFAQTSSFLSNLLTASSSSTESENLISSSSHPDKADADLNTSLKPLTCGDDDAFDRKVAIALTIISRAEFVEVGLAGERVGKDPFFRWGTWDGKTKEGSEGTRKGKLTDLREFSVPSEGFKMVGNPRKEYDAALNSIEWGYYEKPFQTLIHLASLNFIPAKTYLSPATSPLKNPTAFTHLGLLLLSHNDPIGMDWLKRAAEGGSGSGALEYGKRIAASDPGAGMCWLQRAFELTGDDRAAFWAGSLYAEGGAGSEEDEVEEGRDVVPWGIMDPGLAAGKGVVRDLVQAGAWWRKGVETVHHGCIAAYAELRMAGLDGLPVDLEKAERLLVQAAAYGKIPRAMFVLGVFCRYLKDPVDDDGAGRWLSMAKEAGFGDEMALGEVDLKVVGEKAVRGVARLRGLAEGGDARAMYVLGVCLLRGFGTGRDAEGGARWIRRAGELGYVAGWTDPVLVEGEGGVVKREAAGARAVDGSGDGVGVGNDGGAMGDGKPVVMTKGRSELLMAAAAAALAATGGSAFGITLPPPPKAAQEDVGGEKESKEAEVRKEEQVLVEVGEPEKEVEEEVDDGCPYPNLKVDPLIVEVEVVTTWVEEEGDGVEGAGGGGGV